MIYILTLDESNTDGLAPDLVMAGFLGTARQYELLLRRLHQLQRSYGFSHFHGTDFKGRRGEFRGWSRSKCNDLIGEMARAVKATMTEGISMTLPQKQFVDEYKSVPPVKGEMQLSQYGVCFETCLDRAVTIVRAKGGRHRLNIVLENGHKNAGAAKAIFAAKKKELEPLGIHVMGDIQLLEKADSEALMFADFQAYASLLSDRRERAGGLGYSRLTYEEPRRRHAGLSFIQYPPGKLRVMKQRKADAALARRYVVAVAAPDVASLDPPPQD